ncbi:conserved hypothetical protein [Ricinus communis]|uniref:Uncharacterized protein n=2 Tax=Ricinus communis TaxID=3988 RepID=B9T6U5_RICCO|nr:conserved hypothetical protein [Ricinus communis]|eukprot:XP_025015685.1 uncharacterized protein LOC112536960 [Ricinus communis]
MATGPLRPSRFLEEKRWPPFEMVKNRWKIAKNYADVTWPNNTSSPPEAHQIGDLLSGSVETPYRWEREVGNNKMVNQSSLDSRDSSHGFNCFKAAFEPPFRLEVNKDKLLKEKEWLPDLQLRLSQRVGMDENKSHCRSTQEISTKLSLS